MQLKKATHSLIILFLLLSLNALSQYAPQAGTSGSTAIHKDSVGFFSTFYNYKGNEITLNRGWQNISDTSLGKASVGKIDSFVMALPGTYILSLGDKGMLTIPLYYGLVKQKDKPEFVIFENGFPFAKDSFFLELAFVEVSQDGEKYYRFPAHSKTDTNTQIGPFGSLKAHEIHNLAGKYVYPYGVPFEIEDLNDSIQFIKYIRLVDVCGSLNNQYCSRDVEGNKVNDPFPTPFPSSGFDLMMIGFTEHFLGFTDFNGKELLHLYPNPVRINEKLNMDLNETVSGYTILDETGRVCLDEQNRIGSTTIQIEAPTNPGIYFIQVQSLNGKSGVYKFLVLPNE